MTEQEQIKKALSGLHASGDTLTEVLQIMANENKKRFTGKRIAVVIAAAALALTLSVGALAYSGVITSWSGGSWHTDDFTSLPVAEKAVREAGYAPVQLESFENGYAFTRGTVVDNRLEEEVGGPVVESFKSFSFNYEKDGDRVSFDQMRYESEMDTSGEVVATVDGIEIRYNSYRNRYVAADYQLTPEEQAAADAGEIVFSYGLEDPVIHVVQSVGWDVGNMHYCLLQIDGALSPDELAAMAAEIIANSK